MATKQIPLSATITVGDLAAKIDIPVTKLIAELMKNGVMATVNERIDFETAQIVVAEIDDTIELTEEEVQSEQLGERPKRELSKSAQDRPPVVAVMGHVDHGKTSLLDAIRSSQTTESEAGGITQHISAYQVEHKPPKGNSRKITFLDTPGHEAFAALREHGARLTDVAIIVVAADDGVKPQTKEAIRFAQKAGVKIVVALTKIDKEEANPNLVKQQLSDEKVLVEEWGGDIVAVEVSATTKQGIDKLLDMVLLVADVEELKAEAEGPAEGIVIESHMEQGRGAVVTGLVEHGRLHQGEAITAGRSYGKIRTMHSTNGEKLKEALPSTPVVMTGFKVLPQFGDIFRAQPDEKKARQAAEAAAAGASATGDKLDMTSSDLISMINKHRDQKELLVIIRADVQGSLTSVIDSLKTLESDEVSVRVVGSGVGNISENDVQMAATSSAIIYGFNVDVPVNVKQLAAREQVPIRVFKVIYELIDDVRAAMSELLEPEVIETEIGRLIIKGVFRITQKEVICGGEVTKGKATPGVIARVMRDDEVLAEAEVISVQRQQQEAKEVLAGEMCGLRLKTESKLNLKEGDRLEFVSREIKQRTL